MISKEVISSIPVDEFLAVGEMHLQRSPDMLSLSTSEKKKLRNELRGYLAMAQDIEATYSLIYGDLQYGHRIFTGAGRLGLILAEWYRMDSTSVEACDELQETYLWLQNLSGRRFRKHMRSYLQQESNEEEIIEAELGEDEVPVPAEVTATAKEFKAFIAFGDAYEDKLSEAGVDDDDVIEYGRGVLLGAIAIREAIENYNFKLRIGI